MRILREYPYFFANLPFLAVLPALLLTRRRTLSRISLASGIACMPCGLLALIQEPYFRPVLIAGGRFGVEDLMFCFEAGAFLWLAAAWRLRPVAPSSLPLRAALRRILAWGLATGLSISALRFSGVDFLSAVLICGGLLFVGLLALRLRLWPLALAGVACFAPLYVAVVRLQLILWPAYIQQWNPRSPWAAAFILGIPAGELAWALVFALLWPVVIASAFDLEPSRFERCLPVQVVPHQNLP